MKKELEKSHSYLTPNNWIKVAELNEGDFITVPKIEENQLLLIDPIVMIEILEDDSITFNTESKNKALNMNSFEVTQIPPEILKVILNSVGIKFSDLVDLLLQSSEQSRVFMLEFLHDLTDLRSIYIHNESHHLLNSSMLMDLPEGFLIIFFNFSMYSSLNGSQSTGCQSILSQNSWSSAESVSVFMNLSNISFFKASSLPTSDQLTQGKDSILDVVSSSKDTVMLTIYNSPLFFNSSNFSNSASLFFIPFLNTSGQFISGILSNLSFNSLDIENVTLFILIPPHNCVNILNSVDIFKSFGQEQPFSFFKNKSKGGKTKNEKRAGKNKNLE